MKLMIILGSVREVRTGAKIAEWVRREVVADGRFQVDFVDLKELALPLMDEPHHPTEQRYTKPYTKRWSERVANADAFLFVFPEYNHSYSAPIKNALDYLVHEWNRKPVGFVNWGGNSGGSRAQAALRPVVAQLGMVMTSRNLELNFPDRQVEAGVFTGSEKQTQNLKTQLDDCVALHVALAPLR